jgi:tetratricopeptide (TPR) repeat protein
VKGTRALLAGFAKSVLAHRHAFVPGLSRTLEIGGGSRLPASFARAYGGRAPAALDAAVDRKEWTRARSLAAAWARREPSRWEPLVALGVLRLWTSRPERTRGLEALIDRFAAREGLALLEKAAARAPEARLWLSLALLRRVELARAWKELDALCAAEPRWSWPFLARSELGRVDIRYAAALRDCARAAALDRANAWVFAFRARVLFQQRPGPAGMADMDRAVALSPREGWLRAWRADARRKLGDLAGAAKDLEAALRLEPDYDRAYLWLGKTRRALGDAKGAERALTEGLRRCPHFEKALAERCRARLALGKVEAALDDLEKAAALNHRHNALWNWTAEVEPLSDEKRRTLAVLARHAERRPRSGRTWLWLGEALIQAGKPEEGLAALRFARGPRLELFRGEALLRLGRLEEARRALDEAVRRAPSDGRARAFRGRLRLLRGDARGAVRDLELAAADSMIEYSWIYHWRALARRAAGDAAGAREDAASAAQLEPGRPEFRKLARELRASEAFA